MSEVLRQGGPLQEILRGLDLQSQSFPTTCWKQRNEARPPQPSIKQPFVAPATKGCSYAPIRYQGSKTHRILTHHESARIHP
jgi:hypothetical protein